MGNNFMSNWEQFQSLIVTYASQLVGGLLILIVGWWLINRIVRSVKIILVKRNVDITLHPFLTSLTKYTLRTMLVIAVAGMIGIEMTSFIAALGAAGIAVGMALQGSLANLAGGVIILILKPFKVGQYIDADGAAGTVREIRIFHTYLTTLNKQELIVPNGKLANSTIINYSLYDIRGMGVDFNVGYEYDIDKVKVVLNDIIESKPSLAKEPQHIVKVSELNDSYRTYRIQAWFTTSEYWSVFHALPEEVNKRLEEQGIKLAHGKNLAVELTK